jgi:tRNA-Thr(GGU) m(6)t(6)A37 methyltransferase TsaA
VNDYFCSESISSTITNSSNNFRAVPKLGSNAADVFAFEPIGFVESPFKDKYGVPRQSSLANAVQGKIRFRKDPDLITALKSIEQFSHIWAIFVFHQHGSKNWKPSIRPPRLGGRTKVGVLASRSPHRPNPIGLSVLTVQGVQLQAPQGPELLVTGLDVLDGTPVLDVKPYIPYADSVAHANPGWAGAKVNTYQVSFAAIAAEALAAIDQVEPDFSKALLQILELDPRPAYQQRDYPVNELASQGRRYGLQFRGYEIKYLIDNFQLCVVQVE